MSLKIMYFVLQNVYFKQNNSKYRIILYICAKAVIRHSRFGKCRKMPILLAQVCAVS